MFQFSFLGRFAVSFMVFSCLLGTLSASNAPRLQNQFASSIPEYCAITPLCMSMISDCSSFRDQQCQVDPTTSLVHAWHMAHHSPHGTFLMNISATMFDSQTLSILASYAAFRCNVTQRNVNGGAAGLSAGCVSWSKVFQIRSDKTE